MPSAKGWRFSLTLLACTLLTLLVTAVGFFIYASFSSECEVSRDLQSQMKKRLSTYQFETARPDGVVCPTLFFYKKDGDDPAGCAMGVEEFLRGTDVSFGSCG